MKSIFSLTHIISILLITSGILYSQSNYSQSTIDVLNTLNGNVKKAISENDSLSIARAYYKLALKYDYIDENDSCDLYYKKALLIVNKLDNKRAIAIISNAYATTISDRGLHEEAIIIYNKVIELFFLEKDTTGAAGVILNKGSEYLEMGEYKKGLGLSLKALSLKLEIADSINIVAFYHQIGTIFKIVGNYKKWEEYILLANSIAKKDEKYGDFYRRMDLLNELGEYYFSKEKYNLAKNYYDTLYTKSTERDYLVGITASSSNLVSILKKQKKYSEALLLSKKNLAISEKSGKTYRIITNLIQIAKLEIILSKSNNAERKLIRAKDLAVEFNFPNELIEAYRLLSEIYLDNKNYKNAHYYYVESHALKDSLESGKTKQIIAELETKYQTEKKDNQIVLLNKENLLKEEEIAFQNKTVIGLILLGVFSIILFVLFYYHTKLKSENRILNMHQKLLRTQMNPHFMFNALIAIQNYILKNKKFEASDYLSQFASLMRIILSGSRKDFCTLENEIKTLKYYVSLQQLRFNNSFQFQLEVDKNIDKELLHIPPMLIQPFIENAIEHGFRKMADEEKILKVKYYLDSDSLNIEVEDNGVGIDHAKNEKTTSDPKSFAMEITKERLTNITKIYKKNIDISIQDLSKFENRSGTKIKFRLPLSLTRRNGND